MANKKINYPFLKWPGSKRQIVQQIIKILPKSPFLVEPFVGSGVIFLNADFKFAYLNDINPDLINTYKYLQLESELLIKETKKLFHEKNNNEQNYYQLRDKFNATTCTLERSCIFVYLNRHGFNGLCRYNLSGQFNVPFGRHKRPYFPEVELLNFAQKAQNVEFTCCDFLEIMHKAPINSAIYCDPPYIPLNTTSNFTNYSGNKFDLSQQILLSKTAIELANKGSHVLISNHDVPIARKLYKDSLITELKVKRFISANASKRIMAPELLALYKSK